MGSGSLEAWSYLLIWEKLIKFEYSSSVYL